MVFVTYNDLNNDIINNLHKIPHDVDLVVGVPRSGLMLASIIALYLNKPFADLDSFLHGNFFKVGGTKNVSQNVSSFDQIKKVLVVEDTVCSGKSLKEAKEKLNPLQSKYELLYLAAYISSATKNMVDVFYRIIDEERVFEWNYIHNTLLSNACIDIDGVLCRDPSPEENDDGNNYIKFILEASPMLIPTRKVGYIVTSRLEKYRDITVEWLRKNNIEYDELYMMDLVSMQERQKRGNHAQFKAEIYQKLRKTTLFIESNALQAQEIARITKKAVFCVGNSTFYPEGGLYKTKSIIRYGILRPIRRKIKMVMKRIIGKN